MRKGFTCLSILLLACLPQDNSSAQTVYTFAGNGVTGYTDGSGSPTAAEFNHPWGITLDSHGNLFISDHVNSAVRKISASGIISTDVGTTTTGYYGDGGPASAANLSRPAGIAVDAAGNLYIADAGDHRIRKVGTDGIITTIAGTGVMGYSGDSGLASAATFHNPTGITIDAANNLYVADSGNHAVRKITSAGIISTIAGIGLPGYAGDGAPATAASMAGPMGVAFDQAGNLFITECVNNVIRKISPSGIISTFAGNNTAGFSGDDGPAIDAQFYGPNSIAFDKLGNMYISDEWNHRIRKINNAGIITTYAGMGGASYNGDGGPAMYAQFFRPMGLAIDDSNNVYIADYINSVIRVVRPDPYTALGTSLPGEKSFSLYPVPASNIIQAEIGGEATAEAHAEIYNLLGQQLYTAPFKNNKVQINVSDLPPGNYLFNCYYDNKKAFSQCFSKN
jgi:hypothetical protein